MTAQPIDLFYERIAPTVRDAFKTDAAIHAGFAARDEISRSAGRKHP
jgi:hypothetical protein